MDGDHRGTRNGEGGPYYIPQEGGPGRMSRENVNEKAIRYLAEGRIRILSCNEHDAEIDADVRGLGAVYSTGRDAHGWRCDCPSRTADCAHVIALRMITAFEPRATS